MDADYSPWYGNKVSVHESVCAFPAEIFPGMSLLQRQKLS